MKNTIKNTALVTTFISITLLYSPHASAGSMPMPPPPSTASPSANAIPNGPPQEQDPCSEMAESIANIENQLGAMALTMQVLDSIAQQAATAHEALQQQSATQCGTPLPTQPTVQEKLQDETLLNDQTMPPARLQGPSTPIDDLTNIPLPAPPTL